MLAQALAGEDVFQTFRAERRVRIPSALEGTVAAHYLGALRQHKEWMMTLSLGERNARISPQTFQTYPREQQQQLFRDLASEAAEGRGFNYDSFSLPVAEPHPLAGLWEELNAASTMDAVSDLLGERVSSVSAQATRYLPGHWLTRHRDDPAGETRRLAYVLSVTERWHPDWGGLLQFFQDDGTPKDAWVPGFGTLSLFRVSEIHSVTYVAPWAQVPRYSITGWFSA